MATISAASVTPLERLRTYASFVRFEVPAALAFALVLVPMLKGDLRISKFEGGVLLLAFAAWLVFELAITQH